MTVKTIVFIMMMQFIGTNLMAISSRALNEPPRPGDGENKYNPLTKAGESLLGYFYRQYNQTGVPAQQIISDGPFKRDKMKAFLAHCQEKNGYITEIYNRPTRQETVIVKGAYNSPTNAHAQMIVHHISLQSQFDCLVDGKSVGSQKSAAVYLDSDKSRKNPAIDFYVSYANCDSDDRAYLEVGEYSVHYDDNPDCRADVFDVSLD